MKTSWRGLVVAVLLGAILGVIGNQWCVRLTQHQWKEQGSFQKKMMERFNSRLRLTPDQQKQVAMILETKRVKIETLRSEVRPKFEEIRNVARTEIRQLLTPEQQKEFDVMNTEQEARSKKFERCRG